MFAKTRYLLPTTPPQSTRYDPATIVQSSDELDESDCAPHYHHHKFGEASRVFALQGALPHSPMEEQVETRILPTKVKKIDMDMAPNGSMAAQPGVKTPLATHAGECHYPYPVQY